MKRYIKKINVEGQEFTLVVKNYVSYGTNIFDIKVYENYSKNWFKCDLPITDFITHRNPVIVAENEIKKYMADKKEYEQIIKELQEE